MQWLTYQHRDIHLVWEGCYVIFMFHSAFSDWRLHMEVSFLHGLSELSKDNIFLAVLSLSRRSRRRNRIICFSRWSFVLSGQEECLPHILSLPTQKIFLVQRKRYFFFSLIILFYFLKLLWYNEKSFSIQSNVQSQNWCYLSGKKVKTKCWRVQFLSWDLKNETRN